MNGNLVLFYSPGCPHCKRVMPTWNKFSTAYNMYNGIQIVKVDGSKSVNRDLLELNEIEGFPTIKYMPYGLYDPHGSVEYSGDRSYEDIVGFMMGQTGSGNFR